MSDELKAMLEKARQTQMTPRERLEQRISFAYGNAAFEDIRVTREAMVRTALAIVGGRETR